MFCAIHIYNFCKILGFDDVLYYNLVIHIVTHPDFSAKLVFLKPFSVVTMWIFLSVHENWLVSFLWELITYLCLFLLKLRFLSPFIALFAGDFFNVFDNDFADDFVDDFIKVLLINFYHFEIHFVQTIIICCPSLCQQNFWWLPQNPPSIFNLKFSIYSN